MAEYDFDAMRLNVDDCIKALNVHPHWLCHAFDWKQTPQGEAYWSRQMDGMDLDARATVAYFIAQSAEFSMTSFMGGMRF